MEDLPFEGLRVADFSQGIAAPHCGLLLAQNGAEVIKIDPLDGDWGRRIGKTYGDHCANSVIWNRGKKSIALDLKNPDGLAVAKKLAAEADVVLQNFRPGVMKRFGLDEPSVRAVNPSVVYLSLSGYGQTGSKAKLPATDSIVQAFTGLMSINRDSAGTPQRIGIYACDIATGLYAFQAVSAALYRRLAKGKGAHVEVNLMESMGAFQAAKMIEFQFEGGGQVEAGVPIGTFPSKDGYVNINASKDEQFEPFCRFMDREDLPKDPRYADKDARKANADSLMPELYEGTQKFTSREWYDLLTPEDVMCAPVYDFGDYMNDEHIKEVDAVGYVEHEAFGRIPMARIPGHPTVSDGDRMSRAPHTGQHSEEVLQSMGYSAAEIERLRSAGAIGFEPLEAAAAE